MARLRSLVALLVVLTCAACGEGSPSGPGAGGAEPEARGEGAHDHHHAAPHGGALVALGDHFAHLELVFDAERGRLTLYVLDGAARDGLRVTQREIRLRIQGERGELSVVLEPVERALTGETRGDSSEFSGLAPGFRGVPRFEATVETIQVKGQDFAGVVIPWPTGDH